MTKYRQVITKEVAIKMDLRKELEAAQHVLANAREDLVVVDERN